jgi:hypothetical protein
MKQVQLWRMLEEGDVIQPGDYYASSLSGELYRCTPDQMGKKLPFYAMPHLRPAGTREESIADMTTATNGRNE